MPEHLMSFHIADRRQNDNVCCFGKPALLQWLSKLQVWG